MRQISSKLFGLVLIDTGEQGHELLLTLLVGDSDALGADTDGVGSDLSIAQGHALCMPSEHSIRSAVW